ncbi:HupE/UreJ family protein [Planctobacterium marinum]|uniref:HupE/UreJ family protein n=1 Tax=Planctobacterium marinum TaxID=1631968 RepID=UPI001E57F7AA|nr:HupE/UreJ family protein [Planctobacterium marinum]MCC2606687.1 HupE/UreJ family protein [Planctobacterium marinum]
MKIYHCLLTLILVFVGIHATPVAAHPQDEDIILDIEQGQLLIDGETLDEEYLAALKRQRMRKLAAMSWSEKFWLYTKAGFEHIIPKGLDHILFVLGLFFSSLMLGALLWQVTAFTLAHSVTLGLAALGIVLVPGSIVEPLIALSIVWVAVENCVFKQASKWRPAIVFGFGLLHGLGFASVLSDYGLPKNDLVPSLLAFNLGVELGQIAVLLLAFVGTYLFRNRHWYRSRVQIPLSLLIATVGAYWFIERVFL